MKKLILLFLFLAASGFSQVNNSVSGSMMDKFKSHSIDFKDQEGNSIFNILNGTDSLIFTGESANDYFGYSVSDAGDVNGDGYSDVIVGAYGYSNEKGRAYIYFGGANIDNVADIILTGEISVRGGFGVAVSGAGDVNGDGYSDVIVGAISYNSNTGRVYIFLGGENMNSIADIILTGPEENINFGYSLSSAGDVNGDGYSDVIVGSPTYNNSSGRTYIYFGGITMDTLVDLIMSGGSFQNNFGYSLSSAGDVNGDGYSDVIVGAYGYSSEKGRAYVYLGGAVMNNSADVILTGEVNFSAFGFSVSDAGDVNGDGFSDVIVGAKMYGTYKGKAYIFYGGVSMNNIFDVTLNGETSADGIFGCSVSSAGDVNGDGYDDVIVGAANYYSGRIYVFYGGLNMDNIADFIKSGELNSDRFGSSVSGAGDLNGDGFDDVIIGAEDHPNNGRAYIYMNITVYNIKPELISPLNNSTNNTQIINFSWKKMNHIYSYNLKLSIDSLFNNLILSDTIIFDTLKTVGTLNKETKYFWKVEAKDSSGRIYYSNIWNFKTIPFLKLNFKTLFEGMYYPVFNQMTRKDTATVYLRNSTSPYLKVDSAKGIIDSITFSGLYIFPNAVTGTYFIVVKHFNSIETWSKSGGETFNVTDTTFYDFTTGYSKAYGNNLIKKGSKYCIYSGDINQSGFVDATDMSILDNAAFNAETGRFIPSDLNGDNIVDSDDMSIGDNSSYLGVVVIKP